MAHNLGWLDVRRYPTEDCAFSVPSGVYFLLGRREDMAHIDIKSLHHRIAAYIWWEVVSRREYPDLSWRVISTDIVALQEIGAKRLSSDPTVGITTWLRTKAPSILDLVDGLDGILLDSTPVDQEIVSVPNFIYRIWSERADLQQLCDISSPLGRLNLLRWWCNEGCYEYRRVDWRTSKDFFSRVMELCVPTGSSILPLPRFLSLIVNGRPDLLQAFDLASDHGRVRILKWWESVGSKEYSFIPWSATRCEELSRLLMDQDLSAGDGVLPLPRFLSLIVNGRPDLLKIFDLASDRGRVGALEWWENHGKREYSFIASILSLERGTTLEAIELSPSQKKPNESFGYEDAGLNIIGYPFGVLGIGEDVRMAASVVGELPIPFGVIDVPIPGPEKVDRTLESNLIQYPKFPVSLFCLPPTEMLRLAMEGGRHLINCNTYNIGAWPWELPNWPLQFGEVRNMVDEIWAQSEYVRDCFSKDGNTPVYRMPMAVSLPKPTEQVRDRYGIPQSAFIFYAMFDGNSWLSRKNPLAAIKAFSVAFSRSRYHEHVALVVKAINIKSSDPMWQEIEAIVAADSRIRVITDSLNRQDLVNLMASCDCFISLHRSEGFGRVIAEAMLLGQPTVVTNFSGNTDFCTSETSFLVDGNLVQLSEGDYFLYSGQYWCDPDVGVAASQLRRVFEDEQGRTVVALCGKKFIESHYSPGAVASQYKNRLASIFTSLM